MKIMTKDRIISMKKEKKYIEYILKQAPISQEASQFFSRILDKLPLKGVDTADILLLLILFFLFEEKADDELLVALGLLLIL